jgi:hypothetical protein
MNKEQLETLVTIVAVGSVFFLSMALLAWLGVLNDA